MDFKKKMKDQDEVVTCVNYTNEAFDSSNEVIEMEKSQEIKGHQIESISSNISSHRIEWRDLTFEINKKKIKFEAPIKFKFEKFQKTILQSQSGSIRSGEMTALMGPSGSGKTTLLNCITGRGSAKGILGGQVNYITSNVNYKCNKISKLLKLSFVPQKDHLYEDFTIRETLTFAYKFNDTTNENFVKATRSRNSKSSEIKSRATQKPDINSRLEKLALDLNLEKALDTKISKCSGGQVKRVSVAVELISSPNILILDEPTTGLDSMNAAIIIQVIKDLLNKRKNFQNNNFLPQNEHFLPQNGNFDLKSDSTYQTYSIPAVICAIHQPSIETFNLFDKIYVLSELGANIFSGSPKNVINMLQLNGIQSLPGENLGANPADFLLMLCSSKNEIKTITEQILDRNQDQDQIKDQDKDKDQNLDCYQDEEIQSLSDAKKECDKYYSQSNFFSSVIQLMGRNIKLLKYNPSPIIIRFMFCIISSLIMNGMYDHAIGSHDGCYDEVFGFGSNSHSGKNSSLGELLVTSSASKSFHASLKRASNILDNVSFLLISTMFILMIHSLMTVIEVPREIKIVSKEVSNHWYSSYSFITSKLLISFLTIVFHISSFSLFAMLLTSQIFELKRYLILTAVWILLAWISELTGFIIGVIFHQNLTSAIIATVMHSFPIVFFGGFFVKSANTPIYFQPFTWISHMRHVFEAIMITIYGMDRCTKDTDPNRLSFAEILQSSPMDLIGKIFQINNITSEVSTYISPLIGLPDDFCVAQIINATRDYLGLPSPYPSPMGIEEDYEAEDYSDNSISTDLTPDVSKQDISFPLSLFGINEDNLNRCFISLIAILIIYKVITLITLRNIIRKHF